jgi:RimJ/RimL family protein N-acetyltransferase
MSDLCFDSDWIGNWVCERAGGTWIPNRGRTIGRIKNGELVAGVIYEDYNGANVVCHIAGVRDWATRAYLRTIFDYPFNQLRVKRITVPVASNNARSIRFVEHLGFEREATLRDAHPDGDLFIYKITADKCRWVEVNTL